MSLLIRVAGSHRRAVRTTRMDPSETSTAHCSRASDDGLPTLLWNRGFRCFTSSNFMLSSAVWLHTDQTYPHISGAEQIMPTRSLRVKNPATFLSNCLRRRPWPWLRPCRKSPSAFRADPMPPSSAYDPWPTARRRPCRRRSGSCQRIHQVDDVAGIARFHGRSYRLALALLGSAARRVRFRSGLQICPL